MTFLLASVTGPAEAEDAVARGVDIIDVQGAAPPERVRAVLGAVAGRRSVSAGASEASQAEALADAGAEYIRVLSRQSQDIIEAENRINFLLGRYPQRVERSSDRFFDLTLPTLAVGVPAQLLLNRPDIRQAEKELAAAGLEVTRASARAGVRARAAVLRRVWGIRETLARGSRRGEG